MVRERDGIDDGIAEALKAADPLACEGGLSRADAALMRQAVVEAAGRGREASWLPLAAGTALAALSLIALVYVRLPLNEESRTLATRPADRAVTPAVEGAGRSGAPASGQTRRAVRTIHFTAPGGTRVVWSLDPGFELRGNRPLAGNRS